ncbi:uncharacterized protein ACIQIH_010203 [Cyanocitta cristata]
MVGLCCGWRHLRERFQTAVLRFLGPFLTATKFGKDVSKLAAIFIAGFNFVRLLVTLGLQCVDQLSVRCSDLPKTTPLEQDELKSFALASGDLGWMFRASHARGTRKPVRVVRVLRVAARQCRCAERSGGHSRGLRASPRPREGEREVRVRSLYYVV